jgi:hypothetical protein
MKKSVGGTDSVVEVGGANSGIASTFTAYEYTATANQTTFSGSDNYSNTLAYNTGTPPKVQVFMNGILLDEGSSADYTGTNGTSVVLTTGADAGDLVQIHAYKSDVSVSSNINLGDNKKLQFGDAQDLQIYHDSSNSYIRDVGTGNLIIEGSSQLKLTGPAGDYFMGQNNGSAYLYHAGSLKLYTTSTGVQTTGTVNVNGAYALPTSDGSAGQALVTNGSGVLSFATVSGGAVTSMSDTDGDTKIQFEESSDEDIIRFDTGGIERVRVGVDSSSDSTLEIVRTGVPAARGQLTFNGSGLITDVTSGYHSLIVRNGGSEHFRVRSNGNVGIGTTSPDYKLEVAGNTMIGDASAVTSPSFAARQNIVSSFQHGTNGIGRGGSLYLLNTNTNRESGFLSFGAYYNNTNNLYYQTGGIGGGKETAAGSGWGGYLSFWTTSDGTAGAASGQFEHMRITADGNVGIGTTSPSAPLHVVGADSGIKISSAASDRPHLSLVNGTTEMLRLSANNLYGAIGDSTDSQRYMVFKSGNVGIGTTAPSNQFVLKSGTGVDMEFGSEPTAAFIQTYNRTSSAYGHLRFVTNGETMRLTNTGNVGIGTTNPTTKLHVAGIVQVVESSETAFYAGNYVRVFGSSQEYGFRNTGGTTIANISMSGNSYFNGGNVGIGTTTPSYDLDILDTSTASNTGAGVNIAHATQPQLRFTQTTGNYRMYLGIRTNDLIIANDSGTEKVRFKQNGNVGIGTTAPGQPLHVKHSSTHQMRLQGSNSYWNIGTGWSGYYQDYLLFATNTGEKMVIDTAGKVGIGTNDPNTKLHIKQTSSGNFTEALRIENSGGGADEGNYIQWEVANTSGYGPRIGGRREGTGGVGLHFYTGEINAAPTETMRIDHDGNVGIGTQSPTETLHVMSGVSNDTVAIISGSQSDRGLTISTYASDGRTDGGVDLDAYKSFKFTTDGTERARIDSSGNLLVGTTNAANASAGFRAYAGGNGAFTRASTVLDLNRLSTDGVIIQFQKDTVNVGSIGTVSNGKLMMGVGGSSGTNLIFADAFDEIYPSQNGVTTLGDPGAKFKDIHLSGKAHIGHAVIDDYAVNTSATSAAQVDTFAAATFRTARYTIQITNTTDDTYHVTELLLIHDGTTPSITEYGTIYTGSAAEATFDADIVSGNVRLLATPASTDSMQFKVVRHSILV